MRVEMLRFCPVGCVSKRGEGRAAAVVLNDLGVVGVRE